MKPSGDGAAVGSPYDECIDVVDDTEFDAARERVGVGNPSASAVSCGDCVWGLFAALFAARNSSQDVVSLLTVPFAVNTEDEYGCTTHVLRGKRTMRLAVLWRSWPFKG
jgi:hypothetical protein